MKKEELEERARFLARIIEKEAGYLLSTDQRLFASSLTIAQVDSLDQDEELAERVDAFVARFGRLQDTVGDKLLPLLLLLLKEQPGAAIDNFDRAEKLGLLSSVDRWMEARQKRNQMVHEYIEDLSLLTSALNEGHQLVPLLLETAEKMVVEVRQRIG